MPNCIQLDVLFHSISNRASFKVYITFVYSCVSTEGKSDKENKRQESSLSSSQSISHSSDRYKAGVYIFSEIISLTPLKFILIPKIYFYFIKVSSVFAIFNNANP